MTDEKTLSAQDGRLLRIDGARLLRRLHELGEVGGLEGGGCSRLALSEDDKAGRDLVVTWMHELGLLVDVDSVGNVVATMGDDRSVAPVMMGSHIDTVRTGGLYDGNLGVLAGLEVIETALVSGVSLERPLAVAFFSNEEGARFAPDMMGSLAYVGGMTAESIHDTIGIDGARYGEELERIGYLGSLPCPGFTPHSYVELHIEQGPVLESEACDIGVVTGVQGISWQQLEIVGQSAHAGTTPMAMRRDPGFVAAAIAVFVRELVVDMGGTQVGTVGVLELTPNLVNVVASVARMTVDLRNADEELLRESEQRLDEFCRRLERSEGVQIDTTSLARFEPVKFSDRIQQLVRKHATDQNLTSRSLCSGAGHDAQMLARVCDAGMIFVPSVNGLSHNVAEYTADTDNINGANVLLQVALDLATSPHE